MRMSTRGRYGLQALIDMAAHSSGESIALYSIAKRQDISTKYLEQVFSILRKAEIVKSVKGSQGGYMLAAPPSEIFVGNVLRALEGDIRITEEESTALPDNSVQAVIRDVVWNRINEKIDSVVNGITLEDLAKIYKERNINSLSMYYI